MLRSPILLIGLSRAVDRSEKISLKVPTFIAWLLFKVNLLISRNGFLLQVFLRALSSFSAFFFFASAVFFIWALISRVTLPRAINHWSRRTIIYTSWATIGSTIFFSFLDAQKAWKLAFFWALDRSQKCDLVSGFSGKQFISKHKKILSAYLKIP